MDQKSQIQALDGTQPGLPLKKGRCTTMTHNHKRNGTATLLAATVEFLEVSNENPKPFVWTATVDPIVTGLCDRRQTLEHNQPGCTAAPQRRIGSS